MSRALALALLLGTAPASAERYAILVGNNAGRGADAPLRYAESDARRLAAVLTELGGFSPARVRVLLSPEGPAPLEAAFREVADQIARAGDREALLLFYYSGHADGSALHLGEGLEAARLKALLAGAGAAVRVGILDACGAGALAERAKGLAAEPPFLISAPSELAARGQVLIAAVSASEAAQESDALQGSFFSAYLVAGLRGAADRSGAGRVSLEDAYRYAYEQTVRATLLSRAGAQHPSYAFDLAGQGGLVLTEVGRGRARLRFQAESAGELALFRPSEELALLAQVGPGGAVLAVEPGEYEVRKRGPGGLRLARIAVGEGEERELREARMPALAYVPLLRKGLNLRLAGAAGWAWGWAADPGGLPLARAGVDLALGPWLLSPRLGAGRTTWSALAERELPGDLGRSGTVAETLLTGALALERVFELGALELRAGPALEAGALRQQAYGLAWTSPEAALSLSLGAALRLGGTGLLLDLAAQPGLLARRAQAGWAAGPQLSLALGVRYEL